MKIVNITYDRNDGSEDNVFYSETKTEGETYYVISKTPEREGYVFKGWALKPNALFSKYTANNSIKMTAEDLVLYAVWKKK